MLLRAPGTAVLCHPKGSGLLFGDAPLSSASLRHCSLTGQVVPFTPQQIWAEGCLKPTWVLMRVHSPTDSCKPTSSRGMDAFAHQLGSPTASGAVGGRHGIPRLDETSSVPGKPDEGVCIFFPLLNVLLSAGANFQWQSFTFFTPRDF